MTEPTPPNVSAVTGWRKSSHSGNEGGSCLEVLDHHPGAVPVRDSKAPDGPALLIPVMSWAPFIAALKADRLDP
ncbi:DUF397 domain-containing protein [Streptomyces sp. NBC_01754]|uniref:DUF397 domain-containing protein n=1 Tax=Streptomyces sp. NBC_01754 TaxID=2975930 RepID=UPI002DD9973E|nr:DUF397 domain-containing protein [Streptomyces sp. NBC_01754]WSC92576.1 DUF397 domain-containing protein [Streptomyces sp. NBC_01754]